MLCRTFASDLLLSQCGQKADISKTQTYTICYHLHACYSNIALFSVIYYYGTNTTDFKLKTFVDYIIRRETSWCNKYLPPFAINSTIIKVLDFQSRVCCKLTIRQFNNNFGNIKIFPFPFPILNKVVIILQKPMSLHFISNLKSKHSHYSNGIGNAKRR